MTAAAGRRIVGRSRTSLPSFITTPLQQLDELQAEFEQQALPPQVDRSFHSFTDALGTHLPVHVTAVFRYIRAMDNMR